MVAVFNYMSAIYHIFDFIFSAFSSVWSTLKGLYSAFLAIFDSFASFFANIFSKLGIYDTICSGLDTITSLVNQLNGYIDTSGAMASSILSFLAFDTLTSVVLVVTSATFGVVLVVIGIVFVTVIPLLLGWLVVKGVLRLVRLVSAGFVDA